MTTFKPEEITVKACSGYIEVTAEHQEYTPSSFSKNAVTRRYQLPQNIILENLKCNLSAEGILLISAPKKAI